jgi:photosystem II stability/assembly factor-like uncharacterized protein
MFRKSLMVLVLGMLLVTIAAANEHLYLYRGSPPAEAQLKAWQVAVAGYSPDGVILVANDVLGQRMQASHPQVVDLGVWEEGSPCFIIAAEDLTAAMKPVYRATGWALVDDAAALGRERIHGVALEHGRPFIPKERPSTVPQTKPNRYLPGLGAILNGITGEEMMGWVNTLVGYQTRYSPTAAGHQAAEDMADTLAGWGYDVTRWRYIAVDFTDIFKQTDSIWACGSPIGYSPVNGVFYSPSDVMTFTELDLPEEYRQRKNNRIVADGDNVVLAQYGGVLASHDHGLTWENVSPAGATIYKGLFLQFYHRVWCVNTIGQLNYSDDFGTTWIQVPSPVTSGCNAIYVATDFIALGGNFGLYLSRDGGINWEHLYTALGQSIYDIELGPLYLYAVGSNGLVIRFYNDYTQYDTLNLGQRTFKAISFAGSKGIIAGEGGVVFSSSDLGQTWQEVDSGTESTLNGACFTEQLTGMIVGTSGTVMLSNDTLDNWQSIVDHFDPTGAAVWTNVIAQKQGATRPGENVIVCAHLDSITWNDEYDPWTYAPGADDNATGSATVLTLAHAMRNIPTERSLRFILFTGEEEGLIGSNRYAYWSQAQGEDIQAVYNLDMTAYAANGVINQDLISNLQSAWLSDYAVSCAHQYVPGYPAYSRKDPLFVFSDHSPFWGLGVPALCSIESWDVRGENPYYHTPQDLPEWLNSEQMLGACRVAGATIGELAQPGDSPIPSTLAELKVYPNPFRPSAGQQLVTFANLPVGSKVVVYDLAGNRVASITYTDGYRITWRGNNDSGSRLATGVYLYKVSAPGGSIKTGKLAIIN